MPVLGIIASQISGHLFAPSGAYDSIATVTVGSGGQSTISFTSIPSTYKHLQIRGITRANTGGGTSNGYVTTKFNSDSGSNYSFHQLDGNGSVASAGAGANTTSANAIIILDSATSANGYAPFVCDILDYADANKYKTIRALAGAEPNGQNASGDIYFNSASWRNTSAITRIDFTYGGNFAQYSSFALYGIRG